MFALLSQSLFLSVVVVGEGHGVSLPLGDVALAQVHADQVRQPRDIFDLEVLQLQVREENTEMEGVLEGHGVLGRGLFGLSEIELIIGTAVVFLTFSGLVSQLNSGESSGVGGALQGIHERLGVVAVGELFEALGVEVSQVAHEFGAVGDTITRVVELLERERVGDNLDSALIGLEFEEIVHDGGGGLVKFGHAELVELLDPDFLDAELDLGERVVLHHLGDVVDIVLEIGIDRGGGSLFLEEFAEVLANWQVDKDILIEGLVVVGFDLLALSKLREHSQRISQLKQLVNSSSSLKSLNHVNDIVDLISVKHFGQESVQGVDCLSLEVVKFFEKFLLHFAAEGLTFESLVHVGEEIVAVIGVFQVNFEFSGGAHLCEVLVMTLTKDTLSERADNGLGESVVNVVSDHFRLRTGITRHLCDHNCIYSN